MKNKRYATKGKTKARIMLLIVVIAMTVTMMFSTPGIAEGNSSDTIIQSAMRSNFFLKLIGSTVSALKVEENSDDKSFIGQFSINALRIVNKEISFLNYDNLALGNSDVNQQAQTVNNIVINPFKINDGSINKIDNSVNIIGNPEDNSKKKILIYHTHTNEAYAEGNTGLESTVAAVGDTLTDELENQGFTVIHDKTVHDVADYNNAYKASRETFTKYLNSYGDFDLIIDLHRDSGPSKESITGQIEGNNVAKIMFVTTEQDPRYNAHMANIEQIASIANDMYPGLLRTKYLYTYLSGISYYSQDLSDNAILMEVGANVNGLQEAKNSMVYMSRVIAQYLSTK